MPTNNLSPCIGIGGESITDVSIDVTEETAHSLAMNADLSKIREAEMRNHGNGGNSDVEGEGYNYIRLFTDARIEAEANNKDANLDRGLEEDKDNFSSNIAVPALQERLTYAPLRLGAARSRRKVEGTTREKGGQRRASVGRCG